MQGLSRIIFGLVVAVALQSSMAARPAAGAERETSGPDLSSMTSGEIDAEAAGACDNSLIPVKPIRRYRTGYLYALTEYDPATCQPHGAGRWTKTSQQKCEGTRDCGTVTFGVLRGLKLANGACPDHVYNFGAICYTWNEHSNIKVTDSVQATWHPPTLPDMNFTFPIQVPIVYPNTETTAFNSWDSSGLGRWEQTLSNSHDPTFDWSLNQVRETNPGGGSAANDTCHCAGSAIAPFWRITGGTWSPDPGGVWGDDYVGWCAANAGFCAGFPTLAVPYYRQKRRAPCGTTFPQRMQFQATNVGGPWRNYGQVNTLGGSFTYRTVTSTRAGETRTRVLAPVPTRNRLACNQIAWPTPRLASGAIVTVTDPRPLAAALGAIQQVTGVPITFEDAPVLDRAQLAPMVRAGDVDDSSLLIPRGGSLQVTLPAERSRMSVVKQVSAAINAYNAMGLGAGYTAIEGPILHVVPRRATNAAGDLASVAPVLDTRISLPLKERSTMEALAEALHAVAQASGERIGAGTVPINRFQKKIRVSANDEPARDFLVRMLMADGGSPLSWSLLYDPGLQTYYMNIAAVEP